MDTLLYDLSIPAISSLQNTLGEHSDFMQLMSVVFDPKYAFLIYSPIAYLLNQKVGKKLILTTVIAEWLNMILKWILHGERPYWYVHSSGHFDAQQVPIKQFPITCELGPGHPSGHSMVTAAVWFIILDSLLQAPLHIALKFNNSPSSSSSTAKASPNNSLMARVSIWTIYGLLLTLVAVSRVFLGCHFPHQCLAGAALGLLVARYVSKLDTLGAKHFIGASGFLLITAFGTFGLLQAFGFEPAWTIKLATKHCVKREYIHLDTAPFFSIMRYCGFALGCGLGLLVPLKKKAALLCEDLIPAEGETLLVAGSESNKDSRSDWLSSRSISLYSIKIVMALTMARQVDNLGLFVSHANLPLFYSCAFFAYTLFSFLFINL